MSRYFFDIHDSGPFIDDTGLELDSPEAIEAQANRTVVSVLADEAVKADKPRHVTVFVRNEDRRILYSATVTFSGLWL